MSIPLTALLLAAASSLGWSGLDLLRKLLVGKVPPVALVFLITIGSAPLFAVWMLVDGVVRPAPGYLVPALGSVVLSIVANLLFFKGVQVAPLSVAVPLLSLTPVFAALLAVPLLGEVPGAADVAGILLVIAGAIWLNWPPRVEGDPVQGAPARRETIRGALLIALTALFWSLTIPLDKLAVERAPAPFHGFVLNIGVALGVLAILLVQGRLADVAQVRRVPWLLPLTLIVATAALGLQLLALPLMLVGTIETLKRGIGNCMALVSGRIFFGEAITAPKILAVLLMAVGVGLILT
ncbi:MAG TPA: DMT family transporter [Thermoanaerobaculia bacterium]|nr:DMT family transporter [Thermoanaerobaculia bacterium]